MFVYIPRHLEKIEIVSQMTQLLSGYVSTYGDPEASKSFDYYYYYYTVDPVKNFIRMCLYPSGTDSEDTGVLWYLIRLFYSVKGTPKVLDLMESELGLEFVPDPSGRKYTYDNNKITYELKNVSTFNLDSFMEAQEKFLGALLYYHDLTAVIDNARLYVSDTLESDISVLGWTYTNYEI
jgi:hypothetical protein